MQPSVRREPSAHDLARVIEDQRAAIEELQIDFDDEIATQSHIVPIPTDTPPAVRYWQKQLWKFALWAVALASGTTITVVITFVAKDCLHAGQRQFIELHQAPPAAPPNSAH